MFCGCVVLLWRGFSFALLLLHCCHLFVSCLVVCFYVCVRVRCIRCMYYSWCFYDPGYVVCSWSRSCSLFLWHSPIFFVFFVCVCSWIAHTFLECMEMSYPRVTAVWTPFHTPMSKMTAVWQTPSICWWIKRNVSMVTCAQTPQYKRSAPNKSSGHQSNTNGSLGDGPWAQGPFPKPCVHEPMGSWV